MAGTTCLGKGFQVLEAARKYMGAFRSRSVLRRGFLEDAAFPVWLLFSTVTTYCTLSITVSRNAVRARCAEAQGGPTACACSTGAWIACLLWSRDSALSWGREAAGLLCLLFRHVPGIPANLKTQHIHVFLRCPIMYNRIPRMAIKDKGKKAFNKNQPCGFHLCNINVSEAKRLTELVLCLPHS